MNPLRAELELLGPDAVRRGMVAFEHRGNRTYAGAPRTCPDDQLGTCCFLTHAIGNLQYIRRAIQTHELKGIERTFENWHGLDRCERGGREALRLECIAFLAEHGTAVEKSPPRKTFTRVAKVAALVCLLLVVL